MSQSIETDLRLRSTSHPVARIDSFLKSYTQQRFRFEAVRGLLAFALVASFGCLLLLLVDAVFPLENPLRGLFSISIYLAALVAGWWQGLQRIVIPYSRLSLAQELEALHPHFNESLVASLELREAEGRDTLYSREFVGQVHSYSADELQRIDRSKLIPWSVLYHPTIAWIIFALVSLGCTFVSDLHFVSRWMRVAIPFLELDLPSDWRIEVLEPSPSVAKLPVDQILSIHVRLEHQKESIIHPQWAIVEWEELPRTPGKQRPQLQELELKPDLQNANVYIAKAPFGRDKVRYRVRVEDAKTSWRVLEPIERPEVHKYHWTVAPPAYSGLSETTYSSTDGNLKVLQGSRLTLGIESNSELRSASIEMESIADGKGVITELEWNTKSHLWTGMWEAQSSLRIQPRLESTSMIHGSPLTNAVGQRVRLDVETDPLPEVQWVVSNRTLWSEPPSANQTVLASILAPIGLAVSIRDNFPIDQLQLEFRSATGDWRSTPVDWNASPTSPTDLNRNATSEVAESFRRIVEWDWDPVTFQVAAGEIVKMRVRATDKLGQISLTPEIEIAISNEGQDRDRYLALERRVELAKQLATLRMHADEKRDSILELARRWNQIATRPSDSNGTSVRDEFDRIQMELQRWCDDLEKHLDSSIDSATSSLIVTKDLLEQADYELLLATMSFAKSDLLPAIRFQLRKPPSAVDSKDGSQLKPEMPPLDDLLTQWMDATRRMDQGCQEFAALELIKCLSTDTQFFIKNQKRSLKDFLDRSSPKNASWNLESLQRHQKIANQMVSEICQAIDKYAPSVSKNTTNRVLHFKTQLETSRESVVWSIDPSKGMIPGDEQARSMIVHQMEEELRTIERTHRDQLHDSGVLWQAANQRKELLLRSNRSLSNAMGRWIGVLHQYEERVKNKRLSSDTTTQQILTLEDFWKNYVELATHRMLDRRGYHLDRAAQDTDFPSDMGTGWRAWKAVVERWFAHPSQRAETLEELRQVAHAIDALAGIHDAEDGRVYIQSLLSSERYDFRSSTSVYDSPQIWSLIASLAESAQSQLNGNAIFRGKPIESIHALRWHDRWQSAQNVLHERFTQRDNSMRSAILDLEQTKVHWESNLQNCLSAKQEARAILNRYAPTISELARAAAQSSQKMKETTQALANARAKPTASAQPTEANATSEIPRPDFTYQELQDKQASLASLQEQVNREAQSLQEALSEMAVQQNLLNSEEVQKAQDSDQALRVVQRVMEALNDATVDSRESLQARLADQPQTQAQKESIDNAMKKQGTAANAFETIARHFDADSTDTPEDATDSLSNAIQEWNAANELQADAPSIFDEKAYAPVDRLSELARRDPELLMKQLEKELQRNPSMQSELSKISSDVASNARNTLQQSAEQETALSRRLENEDATLFAKKEIQIQQARAIADQADRLAMKAMESSERLSQRLGEKIEGASDAREAIQKATTQLGDSVQQARKLNAQDSSENIQKGMDGLAGDLKTAREQTAQAIEKFQSLIQKNGERDERRRINRVTEANNAQNSIRNDSKNQLESLNNQWKEIQRQAEDATGQSKRQMEEAANRLNQAEERLRSKPDDGNLQYAVRAAQEELANRQQQFQNQQEKQKSSEKSLESLRSNSQAWNNREKASLDKPNPYAALIEDQLLSTQQLLDSLEREAKSIAENAKALPAPQTPAQSLARIERDQQDVKKQVDGVVDDLERASRHERRLDNQLGSEKLQSHANSVQQVAKGELADATKQLANDSSRSQAAEANSKSQNLPQSPVSTRPATAESEMKLNESSNAIQSRAEALTSTLDSAERLGAEIGADESSKDLQAAPMQDSKGSKNSDSTSPNESVASSEKSPGGSRSESGAGIQSDNAVSKSNKLTANAPAQERAREMARILDQLDRAAHTPIAPTETGDQNESSNQDTAEANAEPNGNAVRSNKGNMSSALQNAVNNMARSLASDLNQQRQQQMRQSPVGQTYLRNQRAALNSSQSRPGQTNRDLADDYFLPGKTTSKNGKDWGKLRGQKAEQVLEGTRETFDPEFDDSIRAYYQAIGAKP